MMAVIHPIYQSNQIRISRGVTRNRVVIPYKVLLQSGEDYESVSELKTTEKLYSLYFAALSRDMESACPMTGMTNAILVEVDIIPQRLDVATVVATFATNIGFGGAFRPHSYAVTETKRIKRPRLTEVPSAGGTLYVASEVEYERAATTIVKQFVTANWNDTATAQQAANVNHLFHFGEIPYLYVGADVVGLGNGQSVINYKFWTLGPMHAIPAGTIPGDDVDLPVLGFLDEWVLADGPSIGVQKYDEMYGAGGALPFSDIDGGGG